MSPSRLDAAVSEPLSIKSGERKGHLEDYKQVQIQPHDQAECSMCGDVGLKEELFRCTECQYRHQHTYCSHSYPSQRSYSGVCNWCDTDAKLDSVSNKIQATEAMETEFAKPRTWRNDLEMLLAAAEASRDATDEESVHTTVSSASGGCKKISWSGTKRPRRPTRTKAAPHTQPEGRSILKCKYMKLDSSTFSKRIGRRYKCLLDVY